MNHSNTIIFNNLEFVVYTLGENDESDEETRENDESDEETRENDETDEDDEPSENKKSSFSTLKYKSYYVIAYNAKHNLYYKGTLYRYKGDLFELAELRDYIDTLVEAGDVHFDMQCGHMSFINWKIQYGMVFGKPLITDIELFCKNQDISSVDDIVKRGERLTVNCYDKHLTFGIKNNLDFEYVNNIGFTRPDRVSPEIGDPPEIRELIELREPRETLELTEPKNLKICTMH